MKKLILFCLTIAVGICSYGQSYNQEKTILSNFLVRLYENAPFEGVKAVNDYERNYLMSVVKLDKGKYKSESILNRVASVKAMSQASQFFNGSKITQDMIIHTTEHSDGKTDTEIVEKIQENSIGYVKKLEQLTNFPSSDNSQVYIFITQIGNND